MPSIHYRFTLIWHLEPGRGNMERGKWAGRLLSAWGFVSITYSRRGRGLEGLLDLFCSLATWIFLRGLC